MMKTMEERIKEIKHCAECAIHSMDNHKLPWIPDDGSFDDVISSMHNAKTKDKLSEAYYKYINLCICHGYSDGEIIGGIMQNNTKNKEFNVNIDSVIKSLIEIKYTSIKLSEPVIKETEIPTEQIKPSDNTENTPAVTGAKFGNKAIDKMKKKINYMNNLSNKLQNNESKDPAADINSIITVGEEVKHMIALMDLTSCSKEEITDLNNAITTVDGICKTAEAFKNNIKAPIDKQEADKRPVEQPMAAHAEGGFNIANFIKQNQQPVKGPTIPAANNNSKPSQQKPSVFPHHICGLTDDQIVAEVAKHFKVIQELPAYALYDLANNKLLAKKMKELDAKQRPNNPYLTQVNIHEYIDVPELLAQYPLCFTMPCNSKKHIIIVLFNPAPAMDKNGMLQYPLHIFKATKTNNNNGNK